MPHLPPKSGFTLAELLIALALLGIIAAFTIPKVLQSSAEQEKVAKLRETVATLESAWYNQVAKNDLAGVYLGDIVAPTLNTTSVGNHLALPPFPTSVLPNPHPCYFGWGHDWGWVQFPNGVVVADIFSVTYNPNELYGFQQARTTVLCIDINGPASPNLPGQDVFIGNFNPASDFDYNRDTVYQPTPNGKRFLWGGSAAQLLYEPLGDPVGTLEVDAAFAQPQAQVGYWLTR